MNGYLIALLLFIGWGILLYLLYRCGKIKGAVSLMGPALMIKTTKGRRFIEKVGKSKFWKYYGDFSIILSFIIMLGVVLLLLWQAQLVSSIPASQAPSPVEALGIPGINPVIPVTYGILGLAIAIVFHEFAHGFQVAFHKLKVLSLGILLFIVPIGAFVEPDEEELKKTHRRYRMRVFAAGPITNMLLALVALMLVLSMAGGITPKFQGLYVSSNFQENPNYGILPEGAFILDLNNTRITSYEQLYNFTAPLPGDEMSATIYHNRIHNVTVYSGVIVESVLKGYPAAAAGIEPGWIIYSINGTVIRNQKNFYDALNNTHSEERVPVCMYRPPSQWHNVTVTLADKYEYYEKYAPNLNRNYYRNKGFLGVSAYYLGVALGDVEGIKSAIAEPFKNTQTFSDYFMSFMGYIGLPFVGLMPVPSSVQSLFSVPFPGFWLIFNSLYWLFWLNLMLGMTNLLPAVPLDGGYLFRDLVEKIAEKMKLKNPQRFGAALSSVFSILVLLLILWQFIAPRI